MALMTTHDSSKIHNIMVQVLLCMESISKSVTACADHKTPFRCIRMEPFLITRNFQQKCRNISKFKTHETFKKYFEVNLLIHNVLIMINKDWYDVLLCRFLDVEQLTSVHHIAVSVVFRSITFNKLKKVEAYLCFFRDHLWHHGFLSKVIHGSWISFHDRGMILSMANP